FDQWKEKSKNRRGCIFKRYEKKADFIQHNDDLDNKEGSLWYFKKKKENKSVDNDNGNSNIDTSDSEKDENLVIEMIKGLKSEIADLKNLVNNLTSKIEN